MSSTPKGWSIEDEKLTTLFKCKDFKEALELVNSIGAISEEMQHHPDISVKNYNQVSVSTITHSTNSVTDKDYSIAEKINQLVNAKTD